MVAKQSEETISNTTDCFCVEGFEDSKIKRQKLSHCSPSCRRINSLSLHHREHTIYLRLFSDGSVQPWLCTTTAGDVSAQFVKGQSPNITQRGRKIYPRVSERAEVHLKFASRGAWSENSLGFYPSLRFVQQQGSIWRALLQSVFPETESLSLQIVNRSCRWLFP